MSGTRDPERHADAWAPVRVLPTGAPPGLPHAMSLAPGDPVRVEPHLIRLHGWRHLTPLALDATVTGVDLWSYWPLVAVDWEAPGCVGRSMYERTSPVPRRPR